MKAFIEEDKLGCFTYRSENEVYCTYLDSTSVFHIERHFSGTLRWLLDSREELV